MRRLVARLLAAIGLMPSRRYEEITQRFSDLKRERGDWKKRATKAARRERTLAQRVRDLERQLRKDLRRQRVPDREAHPMSNRIDQPAALGRGQPPLADTEAIRARLADAKTVETRLVETERALTLAREHLNAIEVKLDILEGAANVLDARTRVAPQRRPDKTGAAVS